MSELLPKRQILNKHNCIVTVPRGTKVLAPYDSFLFCCLDILEVMMEPERPIRWELPEEENVIEQGGGSWSHTPIVSPWFIALFSCLSSE